MAETSATAEGDLARTPLAHLLVYALDKRLSGALFLTQPDGTEHVVRLARGVPVKVKPGERFALLGEMLVEAGLVDQGTIDRALATKGLLGDVLLLAGRIERDALEQVAEKQFVRRMVRLFSLPAETTYRYYDGHDALAEYGGDPASCDPLALLWAGLREHGDASTMIEGTLARLGDGALKLHPAATAVRFRFEPNERKVYDAILTRNACLADLCALGCVPPEVARRLAYALAITRQLELGAPGLPLGSETSASFRKPVLTPTLGGTAVARMSLKSTVHRVGAAAPDLPGDGERSGTLVMTSRRSRDRSSDEPSSSRIEVPPSSSRTDVPPSSSQRQPVSSGDAVPSTRPDSVDSIAQSGSGPRSTSEGAPSSGVVESAPKPNPEPAPKLPGGTEITLRSQPAPSLEELRAAAPPGDVPALAIEEASAEEIEEVEDDPFAGKSAAEIFAIATARLAERDAQGAADACDAGRVEAPDDPDLAALSVWARSQLARADVKALAIELDELLRQHEAHVAGRYYRAMLRKRLGDEASAIRDLRRVLELAPDHAEAKREVEAFDARPKPKEPPKERPSLFGKLFKR
jgi:hypothetical protein